jgi:hypothetical protein
LLSCSLISPKRGDERADVLSEDEDDLFLFSEEEKEEDQAEQEKRASSPTVKELAKSLSSCLSGEGEEMSGKKTQKLLSPVSLADQDGDDGTIEDTIEDCTVDDSTTDEEQEVSSKSKPAKLSSEKEPTAEEAATETKPKPKKRVTINTEDQIKEFDAPTPHSQHSPTETKKMSLLEQAKQRNVHADIKPYKPDVEIPDDDSEASMLVLMRYIGCTAHTYGERKPLPEGVVLLDGKEFLGSEESDDDTTLSGWTNDSSLRLNSFIGACTYEEEGVEMTIEEYWPPSMLLTRSVSVDEGTVMSEAVSSQVVGEKRSCLSKSHSDTCPSQSYEEDDSSHCHSNSYEEDPSCQISPTDENTAEGNASLGSDPTAAAKKAVQDALSPRAEEAVDMPKSTKASFKQDSAKRNEMAVSPKVDASIANSPKVATVKETKPKTKTTSSTKKELAAAEKPKAPLPKRKPDITVKTERSPNVPVKKVDDKSDLASIGSQSDALSPASVAKAFLASTIDAPTIKEADEAKPATSPATDAKNYLASPMSAVSRVTLGSIVTKDDESKPSSPASQAKAYLASPKTDPFVAPKSIASKESKASIALPKKSDSAKKPAKKHPVDDLIKAYLSQPKDAQLDNEALMSAISPTTLKSPSVQMILKSNVLSAHAPRPQPTPSSQPTPRVNNTSTVSKASSGKKSDPPRKKLEPSAAPVPKTSAKPTLTRLEQKLAKKKTPVPVQTQDTLSDIQIDRKYSALSPISAISEGTMDTINTEALISMAHRVSSDVRKRTDAAKKSSTSDLLARANSIVTDRTPGSTGASEVRASEIYTIEEVSVETDIKTDVEAAQKNVRNKVNDLVADGKAQTEAPKTKDCFKEQLDMHRKEINALRSRVNKSASPVIKHHAPPPEPEESSSFDKNDVTKDEKKRFSSSTINPFTPGAKKNELTIAVVSPDENAREPPPLTPSRESVREVDELLSKTRNWLAQQNKSRTAMATASPIKEPSLLSRQVEMQFKTTRNLASHTASRTMSENSIREELAALKARQIRNDRVRQCMSKSMGM